MEMNQMEEAIRHLALLHAMTVDPVVEEMTDNELFVMLAALAPLGDLPELAWDMKAGLIEWQFPEAWWPTLAAAERRRLVIVAELDRRLMAETGWDEEEMI